jgi:hypothetical protein
MLLGKLSGFTLGFTGMISSFDHGVIENIGLTAIGAGLLTVAIALLLASPLRIWKITLKHFLAAASLFLLCGTLKNLKESRQERLIVYNIKGKELSAMQDGRVLLLAPADGDVPAEVKKHAATRGLKIKIIQSR